jgi:hypothetical protein
MNYKDKFEQSDKKALNSLIATKILDLMDKLRPDRKRFVKRTSYMAVGNRKP